jgi:hypothetical protein
MNEKSWTYYTAWFWHLGWFEHRFDIKVSQWLDTRCQPCRKDQAAFMRIVLQKVVTTPAERTGARILGNLVVNADEEVDRSELPEPTQCAEATCDMNALPRQSRTADHA